MQMYHPAICGECGRVCRDTDGQICFNCADDLFSTDRPLQGEYRSWSIDLWCDLAAFGNDDTQMFLLTYGDTPPQALHILASNRPETIRSLVAQHPNTAPETLAMLSVDAAQGVRLNVADHPSTPDRVLWHLGDLAQQHVYTVTAVAENPSTPLQLLRILALSGDAAVRAGVAQNQKSNDTIVDLLVADEDNTVLICLARREIIAASHLQKLAQANRGEVLHRCIASNRNSDAATLDVLLDDGRVNANIVLHPTTSARTLQRLASKDGRLCGTIIKHPNTALKTLVVLSFSHTSEISAAATGMLAERKQQGTHNKETT